MSERDTHPTEPSSGVEQLAFDLVESTLPEQYRLDPETRRLGLYHVALIRRQIAEQHRGLVLGLIELEDLLARRGVVPDHHVDLPADRLDRYEFAGELALTGELRAIRGALAMAAGAAR